MFCDSQRILRSLSTDGMLFPSVIVFWWTFQHNREASHKFQNRKHRILICFLERKSHLFEWSVKVKCSTIFNSAARLLSFLLHHCSEKRKSELFIKRKRRFSFVFETKSILFRVSSMVARSKECSIEFRSKTKIELISLETYVYP